MAGLFRFIFGGNDGGNNGTVDAFNNSCGRQDFDEANIKTGANITNGDHRTSNHNNGTKKAFNNSFGGTQKFGKAKIDTGARIGN
ncbi:unnamed protein product [Lathyrus oleraceus]